MIGDAIPTRFSERINMQKSRPIRQKKKRTSNVNTFLLHGTKKAKVGRANKLEKKAKQASKFLKHAFYKLKPVIQKRSEKNISKVDSQKSLQNLSLDLPDESKKVFKKKNCEKSADNDKRSHRRSLRLSKPSQNLPLDLPGESKKIIEKKKLKKSTNNKEKPALRTSRVSKPSPSPKGNRRHKEVSERQSYRKSLRVSKSSQNLSLDLPDENNKEKSDCRSSRASKSSSSPKEKNVSESDMKSSKRRKSSQKKSLREETGINSKSVLFTPNPGKSKHTSKHSEKKKMPRLSTESLNQEISVYTPTFKSVIATPAFKGVDRLSRYSENQKSTRFSKELNPLRLMNPEVSLYTSAFQSLLDTPQPEKHSEKRKSSRLLETSPLRTLNKELSLSAPASLIEMRPDSAIKKSSKRSNSTTHSRKQSRYKVSNKDICPLSQNLKQNQKRQINQRQKTSDKFIKPLSNETENLPLDILTTPAFKPVHMRSIPKKYLSKSNSKSSKSKLNALTSENHVGSEKSQDANKRKKSADFPKMPCKGTLKRKRLVLQNLRERTEGYEDDIFENQNINLYKPAFHFGDESDGSSVNIATPKFDFILTPALPKKTPRFKDCISPTEFLNARKTAEEYLQRRNKKRKSGDKIPSAKKTSMNKSNLTQDVPEKKKLDFEEAVNKLIAVQKDLEKEAAADGEEEDLYFSDSSN